MECVTTEMFYSCTAQYSDQLLGVWLVCLRETRSSLSGLWCSPQHSNESTRPFHHSVLATLPGHQELLIAIIIVQHM